MWVFCIFESKCPNAADSTHDMGEEHRFQSCRTRHDRCTGTGHLRYLAVGWWASKARPGHCRVGRLTGSAAEAARLSAAVAAGEPETDGPTGSLLAGRRCRHL